MDTRELEALIAVADAQSFHGAANRLGLTQPAVTRRIQRLEERIGTSLFDRSTKPLQPTPAGHRALTEARDLLRRLDGFSDSVTGMARCHGPFRLGVSHGAAPLLAARELRDLHQAFPDMSLTIKSGWSAELLPLLRRGEIDAMLSLDGPHGIVGGVQSRDLPASLLPETLLDDHIVAIGPKSARQHPTTIAELARHPMVLMPEGCTFRALGNAWAHKNGVEFNSVLEVSALELQIEMVAAGAGYGIMARRFCMHSPAHDRIRILDIPGMNWGMAITLIRRASSGDLNDIIDKVGDIVIRAGEMSNLDHARMLSAS
ncbi:LysR family transcriptional regulator [uncultured Thalassospira sp.]|uniref:LysR family transcriptional regulator n=1 Tax=uncultured Thalassospira sp. TaxID=404382 RepID=UPI002595F2D1|nr:LysR family transcriptional regulator [uncultured Thalassospira sp.]|tara:strand:+ start:614 stop:1561 length:948 start_codon:yes stop_codon:yes gene_type:complete